MAWVRQYSAPNVVGDGKLKALISYTINPLCVFEPLFGLGGLGATYAVHLRLIGNPVVDFLLAIIELLSRCYGSVATSKYRLQVAVFKGVGHSDPIFQTEGNVPHQPFVHG